jgi:putative IMPACT (imprinted ancient) family translation regulator
LLVAPGGPAAGALRAAGRLEKYIEEVFEVTAAFEHEQEIHRLVAKFGARVLGSEYTDAVCYRLSVKASSGRTFEQAVNDHYQLTGKLIVG